jgi:hypothetical protein
LSRSAPISTALAISQLAMTHGSSFASTFRTRSVRRQLQRHAAIRTSGRRPKPAHDDRDVIWRRNHDLRGSARYSNHQLDPGHHERASDHPRLRNDVYRGHDRSRTPAVASPYLVHNAA